MSEGDYNYLKNILDSQQAFSQSQPQQLWSPYVNNYLPDQFIEEDLSFTPLTSPAMTPSLSFQNMNLNHNLTFSPLTSPALRPTKQYEYQLDSNDQHLSQNQQSISSIRNNNQQKRNKTPSMSPYVVPKRKGSPPPVNLGSSHFSFMLSDSTSVISPALTPQLIPSNPSTLNSINPITPSQLMRLNTNSEPLSPGLTSATGMNGMKINSENEDYVETELNLEARKKFHKHAEQKRRDSLKNSFEELRKVLPPTEKNSSKLLLLKHAADFIRKARLKELENEKIVKKLQDDIRNLAEIKK
ncbi:hypothetical protein HK099_003028 [Clydaea vesicula]|uniref:BHLH domain-containing protein n=1 Tax=Clydaea vesicula TaxID=447962 RepID=A0AAD5XRT2_9FUNG|nr:hypothetical protein HK099_003028 [Clydaea vesicula]KAJ3377840.1 hypothetical protein HDU92_007938 [Lobulomyces angularis]